MRNWKVLLATIVPIIMSACSDSSEPAIDPASGLYRVAAQSNSVKATDFYINGDQFPLESCGSHECTAEGGFVAPSTRYGTALADHGFVTVAEIGGIEIVRTDREDDWTLLGGWMDHSAFFVNKLISSADRSTFLVYSQSLGRLHLDESAALPATGSASYNGAMAGTNIMTADRYTGESSMIASFGETSTIDIHFTEIMNVSTGESHSEISYVGVPVSDRKGIFGHPSHRSYVNGEFMGPDNDEVVGVFEHEDLIGAFGAKRTE